LQLELAVVDAARHVGGEDEQQVDRLGACPERAQSGANKKCDKGCDDGSRFHATYPSRFAVRISREATPGEAPR